MVLEKSNADASRLGLFDETDMLDEREERLIDYVIRNQFEEMNIREFLNLHIKALKYGYISKDNLAS